MYIAHIPWWQAESTLWWPLDATKTGVRYQLTQNRCLSALELYHVFFAFILGLVKALISGFSAGRFFVCSPTIFQPNSVKLSFAADIFRRKATQKASLFPVRAYSHHVQKQFGLTFYECDTNQAKLIEIIWHISHIFDFRRELMSRLSFGFIGLQFQVQTYLFFKVQCSESTFEYVPNRPNRDRTKVALVGSV